GRQRPDARRAAGRPGEAGDGHQGSGRVPYRSVPEDGGDQAMKRALILIALALWTASPARTAAPGEHATVTFLKGMARLQPKSGPISVLTLGRIISQGDSVLTLENAKVELKLDNGTAIR